MVLTTSVWAESSQPRLPVSGDKSFFHSGTGRAPFTGDFYLLLSGSKGEVEHPLAAAAFQVPLAQNNPYANVADFAVTHCAVPSLP